MARAAVTALAALVLAATAAAAPPRAGLLVPGASLGGIRLGETQAQVRRAWGPGYGRCRGCAQPTWYYNYRQFRPQGAGVRFRGGRVDAVFTLWSPLRWRTTKGLKIGEPEARVTTLYGTLARAECGTYSALLLPKPRGLTAFYVVSGRVWGFGLLRPGAQACL